MQLIKTLFFSFLLIGVVVPVLATPPFQILRTCMDNKPYNNKIKLTRLDGDGLADKPLEGCQEQYERSINGHMYGTATCDDKFYLLINDKKYDPTLAENYSINPEIKPGVEFSKETWWQVDSENQAYLCIYAALSDSGIGAAYNQYYIIENPFGINSKLYYYFFDKNVVPIGSKTL